MLVAEVSTLVFMLGIDHGMHQHRHAMLTASWSCTWYSMLIIALVLVNAAVSISTHAMVTGSIRLVVGALVVPVPY